MAHLLRGLAEVGVRVVDVDDWNLLDAQTADHPLEIRELMDIEDFGDDFIPDPEIAKVEFQELLGDSPRGRRGGGRGLGDCVATRSHACSWAAKWSRRPPPGRAFGPTTRSRPPPLERNCLWTISRAISR
jgi:hypothetical protein